MQKFRRIMPALVTLAAVTGVGCAPPPRAPQSALPSPAERQRQFQLQNQVRQLEAELRALRGEVERLQYRLSRTSDPYAPGVRPQPIGPGYVGADGEAREQGPPGDPDAGGSPPVPPATPERADDRVVLMSGRRGRTAGAADDPAVAGPDAVTAGPVGAEAGAAPGAAAPGAAAPGRPVGPYAEAAPSAEQRGAYNDALDRLRAGHHQQAARGFEAFIADYPDSPLLGEAYYWLGESRYIERDFEAAKRAYLTLGASHPSSPKLPDALLKLGYIYQELEQPERSQEMLRKLVEAFPDSEAAQLARGRLREP